MIGWPIFNENGLTFLIRLSIQTMKASCIAVFFALLLSVCVSSQYDVDNTPWDGMKCEDLHYM